MAKYSNFHNAKSMEDGNTSSHRCETAWCNEGPTGKYPAAAGRLSPATTCACFASDCTQTELTYTHWRNRWGDDSIILQRYSAVEFVVCCEGWPHSSLTLRIVGLTSHEPSQDRVSLRTFQALQRCNPHAVQAHKPLSKFREGACAGRTSWRSSLSCRARVAGPFVTKRIKTLAATPAQGSQGYLLVVSQTRITKSPG